MYRNNSFSESKGFIFISFYYPRQGTWNKSLFSKGIPVPVSIKEAIVLALKYSSDESCSFINGILDTISKRALQ